MRLGSFKARSDSRGFTYLWALMAIALMGIALARVGPTWAQSVQRDREAQLMRVGWAYAQAVERYYHAQPVKQFPDSLEQLVSDPRFTVTVRHLRDLYSDPVNPGASFEPVRSGDGRVMGVRSRSDAAPIRTQSWSDGRRTLPAAQHYSEWQFLAQVDG
jgi:type II secretory pathway pseudopilin PulG